MKVIGSVKEDLSLEKRISIVPLHGKHNNKKISCNKLQKAIEDSKTKVKYDIIKKLIV